MFRYRDHRGSLSESMGTVQEFTNRKELINYLQTLDYPFSKDRDLYEEITIERYGNFDERISWNIHIVYLKRHGVFGFTDQAVNS